MDDTILFKKIVRSQNGLPADIADVMKYLMQDHILCRCNLGKRVMWIQKLPTGECIHLHVTQATKIIFDRLIPIYYKTARFLYDSAFCEQTDTLLKPHYLTIANKLIKVVEKMKILSVKSSLMQNLSYDICSYS